MPVHSLTTCTEITDAGFFMGFWELFTFAVGVSMDALAVSICKGLSMKKTTWRAGLTCGIWFGGFQALMPLLGYYLGRLFSQASLIQQIDHWIAFVLLAYIGGNMLVEAFKKDCECCCDHNGGLNAKLMFPLAIATSIDALALGISPLGTTPGTNIWLAVALIGIVTCAVCTVGVKISNTLGKCFEKKAQILGGGILVILGCIMLIDGLMEKV